MQCTFCTKDQHARCQSRGDIYFESREGEMWELFGRGFYMKVSGLWYSEVKGVDCSSSCYLSLHIQCDKPIENSFWIFHIGYVIQRQFFCIFVFLYFLCVWGDVDVLMVQPAAKIRLRKWKELPCSKSLHFFLLLCFILILIDDQSFALWGLVERKRAVSELQPHSDLKNVGRKTW